MFSPEDVVERLRAVVVDDLAETYQRHHFGTPSAIAKDPRWRRALELLERLSTADRQIVADLMRQVSVDTLSTVFGIVDGTTSGFPSDVRFELWVSQGSARRRVDGNLQDFLLEST